jgi:phosphoribosylamine--glycine ligase
MKILVVGGGGREHAMTWAFTAGRDDVTVVGAPGNPGVAQLAKCVPADLTKPDELLAIADREQIDLTVVGPEVPLSAGIADMFGAASRPIVGPTRAAAALESSKAFAKHFMARHSVPTARFADCTTSKEALDVIAGGDLGLPIVVKADGLAAGKGVVVATTVDEAHAAVDAMLVGNALGAAGARVVVEDFLDGEEASFIVMVDGRNVLPLASSQDHKRLRDDDRGPNTGGMGAYSPAPVVTPALHARIMREVIQPTVTGMAADGYPYVGFLYAGVMIDAAGVPRVLEFNCRMGDPETQPIIVRLKSDLLDLLLHATSGTLDAAEPDWDRRAALGAVLAADGYPDDPRRGDVISGLDAEADGVKVFHAGTSARNGEVVVSGGRVLCVTALGDSVKQAQRAAYAAIAHIHFDGMQYRHDIGHRALAARKP